jgi:uncharacterized protein
MNSAAIRFYEELNDFLPSEKKKKRFKVNFLGNPSVRNLIESLGIPHIEIDLILLNGESVNFNQKVSDGDDISVYPVFESFDIANVQSLRPAPLRCPKFVLDVHFGKLSKLMRMVGLNTFFQKDLSYDKIIKISLSNSRTILTRNTGILKQKRVTHGYFIRTIKPEKQIVEVISRFDLWKMLKPFTRCIECNNELEWIDKAEVLHRLPEQVRTNYKEFKVCGKCDKLFWEESRNEKLLIKIIGQQNDSVILKPC